MGHLDFVKPFLERAGTVHFGRVLLKPGKPTTFATVSRGDGGEGTPHTLVFGLPGNPVSANVTFHLFAVPALRLMSGRRNADHAQVPVELTRDVRYDPNRPEFHRATVVSRRGRLVATSTGVQRSSRLLSMRDANALLLVPQDSATIAAGSTIGAMLLGDIVNEDDE